MLFLFLVNFFGCKNIQQLINLYFFKKSAANSILFKIYKSKINKKNL